MAGAGAHSGWRPASNTQELSWPRKADLPGRCAILAERRPPGTNGGPRQMIAYQTRADRCEAQFTAERTLQTACSPPEAATPRPSGNANVGPAMKHFELCNNNKEEILRDFAPRAFSSRMTDQREIPALAKDLRLMADIQKVLPSLPTFHHFHLGDAVSYPFPPDESLHLVVTSPPYWILKRYPEAQGQLGHESDYTQFLSKLNTVWGKCFRCLVPGGRLIVVVGDVCLSRRQNKGRHAVIPFHAAIQEGCRNIGFDNLAPIIWIMLRCRQTSARTTTSWCAFTWTFALNTAIPQPCPRAWAPS